MVPGVVKTGVVGAGTISLRVPTPKWAEVDCKWTELGLAQNCAKVC